MLEFSEFLHVVKNAPLIAMDLIIQNEDGNYLLGKRINSPAKGDWFVPGGRIMKNEMLDQAFERITLAEVGAALPRKSAHLLGVYEHFYATNAGDEPGYGTHYVVLAHTISTTMEYLPLTQGEQHASWRWQSRESICNDPSVNRFTKAYFE